MFSSRFELCSWYCKAFGDTYCKSQCLWPSVLRVFLSFFWDILIHYRILIFWAIRMPEGPGLLAWREAVQPVRGGNVCVCVFCRHFVESSFIFSVFFSVFFTLFTASGRHDVLHSGRTCQTRGLSIAVLWELVVPSCHCAASCKLAHARMTWMVRLPAQVLGRREPEVVEAGTTLGDMAVLDQAREDEEIRRRYHDDIWYLGSSDVIVTSALIQSKERWSENN